MTSYLPRPTGTVVGFIKKPEPITPSIIDVMLANIAEHELRPRRNLHECFRAIRLTDCLKTKKTKANPQRK